MKTYRQFIILSLIIVVTHLTGTTVSQFLPYSIIILKDIPSGLSLVQLPIAEGETKTLVLGKESGFIDIIMPISPGTSGSVVQHSAGVTTVVLHRADGKITSRINGPGDKSRSFPPSNISDLLSYKIRINITSIDGPEGVFIVDGIETPRKDISSPVIDMFGGMIPLNPGDYSLTVQTSIIEKQTNIVGKIPLIWYGPWLWAPMQTKSGEEGLILVDFGASGTVLPKIMLSDNAVIQPLVSIQYSETTDTLSGKMMGAGGEVAGNLGISTLETLYLGDIPVPDVKASIMKSLGFDQYFMEESEHYENLGILGGNILGRASVVRLDFDRSAPVLTFGESSVAPIEGDVLILPFVYIKKNIFVNGAIGDQQIHFLLDTGARRTTVSNAVAKTAGVENGLVPSSSTRGLDGTPIPTKAWAGEPITFNGQDITIDSIFVSDLPVLSGMGLANNGGLLGIDFLSKFGHMEVDYTEMKIKFW